MRKCVKKWLAFVLMATIMTVGNLKVAKANEYGCPPHGPYDDIMVDCYRWAEYHYPVIMVAATDQYGDPIPVYGENGSPLTTKCLMSSYRKRFGVFCVGNQGKCMWYLNGYFYETPVTHTYCAVG